MTIESTLERIAEALEKIADRLPEQTAVIVPKVKPVKILETAKFDEEVSKRAEEKLQLSYIDVRNALLVLQARGSKDTVKELLAHFKVKAGQDLKPEQYAEVIEYANSKK